MDCLSNDLGWLWDWQRPLYESSEGYAKTKTVGGFPAKENYYAKDGMYSLLVNVNDRFAVNIYSGNKDMLYDFADLINYNGIAALGGGAVPSTETAQPTGKTTQPSTTETPTTPAKEGKTPGFELGFVITSLLALAYILSRNRK